MFTELDELSRHDWNVKNLHVCIRLLLHDAWPTYSAAYIATNVEPKTEYVKIRVFTQITSPPPK